MSCIGNVRYKIGLKCKYAKILLNTVSLSSSSSSLFEIRPQGSIKQYTVNIKTDAEKKENTVQ